MYIRKDKAEALAPMPSFDQWDIHPPGLVGDRPNPWRHPAAPQEEVSGSEAEEESDDKAEGRETMRPRGRPRRRVVMTAGRMIK